MSISVVIPALNEEHEIETTIRRARDSAVCEILVADGGSRDATARLAATLADRVIESPPGRACQMNAGAEVARGDILLFLHADTYLPEGFGTAVEGAIAAGSIAGRFDVELRGEHPMLRVVARAMSLRSRLTGIFTGDQAIFIRRDVFSELGGFAAVPLMEDIALARALKRRGRTAALRLRASTSGRRWEKHGIARTIFLMWWLRLAYFCGASPERLARRYRRHDEPVRVRHR